MAANAALLKHDIEARLANRIPGALSPQTQHAPRLHPTGNAPLDVLLGGGLPLGTVCEVTGPAGSGRTSIALSVLATASPAAACAYIDGNDVLSPASAAAAGVELTNLLWVRVAASAPARQRSTPESGSRSAGPVSNGQQLSLHSGCGSSHPRTETKGLAPALEQMLFYKEERRRRKMEGTPGHPNQPLGLHTASQEQVDWERFNLRRVDETDPLRRMDKAVAVSARQRANQQLTAPAQAVPKAKPLDVLDRAVRATDQVLQSGGFRIVVLDLASVADGAALRIPSATWFRFRRAAQESDAILLLLTGEPCARSSAACVLQCSAGSLPTVQGVLSATPRMAEIARQRTGSAFGKKAPGRAAAWEANSPWMRAVGR